MKKTEYLRNNMRKKPVCNGRAERAPYIFGKCFILCWRCTTVMIFSTVTTIILYYIDISVIMSNSFTIIGGVLVFPMIVDGVLQYIGMQDSTNVKRALTGSLFGIGIAILAFQAVVILNNI